MFAADSPHLQRVWLGSTHPQHAATQRAGLAADEPAQQHAAAARPWRAPMTACTARAASRALADAAPNTKA